MSRLGKVVVLAHFAPFVIGCSDAAVDSANEPDPHAEPSYCSVQPIIERYCLRCHGDPVANFAPFPLDTWESTQQLYPSEGGDPMWQSMQASIERGFMPLLQLELDPPVEPLPPAEEEELLAWLAAGAPRGADCE